MMKLLLAGVALAAVLTACPGGTMTNTYKTTLNAANEVQTPAVVSTGTGSVTAVLDLNTNIMTVTGTYTGLSGAVSAPGAHIHGPAAATANAPILFNLTYTEGTTAGSGTITGTTTALTPAQITDVNNGLWYVNLHTVKYPNGEIRGQLAKQ